MVDIREAKRIEQEAIDKVINQMRRSIYRQIADPSNSNKKYILHGLSTEQLIQIVNFVISFKD